MNTYFYSQHITHTADNISQVQFHRYLSRKTKSLVVRNITLSMGTILGGKVHRTVQYFPLNCLFKRRPLRINPDAILTSFTGQTNAITAKKIN